MKNQGFTLLEVLVALLVLSIGLLGLAGLQTTGLRSNHNAFLRTQAVWLAYDMADRVRANSGGALAGVYSIAPGVMPAGYPGCLGSGSPPSGGACDCVSNACSPANMAAYDLGQWKDALARLLPAGDGEVTQAGSVFTIIVRWDENRTGATGTGCDPSDANDLQCFSLRVSL